MKNDKFDEFYMKQTQAKNKEKMGRSSEALKLYLDIIENYFPDTDYSFEHAVLLLEKANRLDEAKSICTTALERIKSGEMKGNKFFFETHLLKIDEKTSSKKSDHHWDIPAFFKNRPLIVVSVFYLLAALIYSLPSKIYKFIFIVFIGVALVVLFELLKSARKSLSIKFQSIALIFSLFIAMAAAAQLPPPDWTNFFSLQSISEMNTETTIERSVAPNEDKDSSISSQDVDTLEAMFESDLVVSELYIEIDDNLISISLYLKPAATTEEAKNAVKSILLELNSIKGYERPDDNRMGDLYKDYSTQIQVFDSFSNRILRGQVRRFNQKLNW
ncbi:MULTISPECIES: hypothetical protein [unclassified Fusibacter]|uniref:hypothetical protein n=1 Tax=unclassified Fusibacter TaxID=2624464 RepID=UPI001011AC47|nr:MULTISPECIES: hypothetical protein [unclassified Fusibacter]MCK8058927.1 hypothetical protein [Fusibacter sp. A2]NPE22002.1 hypothetical protein [Fusibacter sp. A1]RXV61567.1 hypothetical protein DWB64_09165 [Fusibacter sp. A1]